MIHGKPDQAHKIVDEIERSVTGHVQDQPARLAEDKTEDARSHAAARGAHAVHAHRQRSLVGLTLMIAQAFFYNAIFFTFALVLTDFFRHRLDQVGWYILPFAAGILSRCCSAGCSTRWAAAS